MTERRVHRFPPRALPALLAAALATSVPRAAPAQSVGIFEVIGDFVASFDAASGFYAPAGLVLDSDALEEEGGLRQVGFMVRRSDLDLAIGLDVTTGFTAKEESLDLRGSIRALPTLTKFYEIPVVISEAVPTWLNLGLGLGASRLVDARSAIPDGPDPRRAVELEGSGYHLGFGLGLSFYSAPLAGYLDASVRYTDFPSLDWKEGSESIVPPAGWPDRMDLWTGVLRLGIGFALGGAAGGGG